MATLTGQPEGAFGITSLRTVEGAAGIAPSNVIGQGKTFQVEIKFEGDPDNSSNGLNWKAIRNDGKEYQVIVYIESIGAGFEGVLAQTPVFGAPDVLKLVAGQDKYVANVSVVDGKPLGIGISLAEGLYKIGAVVRIKGWDHWVGFLEDYLVDVKTNA